MSLFNELKRRNVFKVGIAYAVVAWLIMQVADVMIDNIGAPDWVFRSIVLVLALGFPLVLIFAWAFEMTPEGIKREQDVDRSQSITPQTGQKLNYTIITVMALALGYFVWDKFSVPAPEQAATSGAEQAIDKSIAVLPFVNMSADENNEYFSDGLSEELLNLLAKVDGLKVAARTSSFKFKNSEDDIADIGKKLNVATILEGSVRKSGNQARITAQLIKVDDGFHLWSETYDRDLDNIFLVQDEIARAIVDALKLPLLGQGKAVVASKTTSSFEAYDLYLLGRHHFRERNEQGFQKAIDYFSRATAIDPNYAPAWSGLASSYMLLSDYGSLPFSEAVALSESAIAKAQLLDPNLSEAWIAQGDLLSYLNKDHESEQAYARAYTIDPNNVAAVSGLAGQLAFRDPQQSLELAKKAWTLDPLSEETRVRLVVAYMNAGALDVAESTIRKMLLDDPDNPGLYEVWFGVLMDRGQVHLAIPKIEMTHRLRTGDVFPAGRIVGASLLLDDMEMAEQWLANAQDRGPDSQWTTFAVSLIHEYEGQLETYLDDAQAILAGESASFIRRFSVAEVLVRSGRTAEAESMYRGILAEINTEAGAVRNARVAAAMLSLAALLPAGDERTGLLGVCSEFSLWFLTVRPYDELSSYFAARLASVNGDPEAMLTALKEAWDKGFRARWWVETSPFFSPWKDNPQFQALMLQWKQEATRMREQFHASEAAT